jgi:hypothetical protein
MTSFDLVVFEGDFMSVIGPVVAFPDKSEIVAAVLAFAPFICNFSVTSSSSVNGRIVARQSTDYVDIGLGVVAILAVLYTLRLWSQTSPEDKLKRIAVFVGLCGLSAYQILSGFGVFTNV